MTPALETILARGKLLLGVVHLAPLPGSPRHRGEPLAEIEDRARDDARKIVEAGFDGYVIENFGDVPFFPGEVPPHVLTTMTRIATNLPRDGAFIVVNVLRNDARGALAIATACEFDAIRVNVHSGAMVTDQGVIEGRAAYTLRERNALAPNVAILADVDVKHADPLAPGYSLEESARDTYERGLADALIVTGTATGSITALDDVDRVRSAVPSAPVLVGSGATRASVASTLRQANGIIVGSAIKTGGDANAPVDGVAALEFVRAAREARVP